jgi:hypothetical protein
MRLLSKLLWRLRSNRQGSNPLENLVKLIADRSVNLVIAGAAVQQPMFLPGSARDPGKLFELHL